MQRSKLAEEKPADDTEDIPADAAERATKRTWRPAAAQKESSVGLVQHAPSNNAAADPAMDNEKAFRRLRRVSRKNFSADPAAEEQSAAETTAAMTDGKAAVQAANPDGAEEAQEPEASALQIAGPAAATAHGNQDTAVAKEAQAPAAGAERQPQPRKAQPKAAAQEAAGANNPAMKVSADGQLPCHRASGCSGSQRERPGARRSQAGE